MDAARPQEESGVVSRRLHSDSPLYRILRDRRLISPALLEAVVLSSGDDDAAFEQGLVNTGEIDREGMRAALENNFFVSSVDLQDPEFRADALLAIPRREAARNNAFPLAIEGDDLRVALAQPDDKQLLSSLARRSGKTIVPLVALSGEIQTAIRKHYARLQKDMLGTPSGPKLLPSRRSPREKVAADEKCSLRLEAESSQSAVDIVDQTFLRALEARATDIHVEPFEKYLEIRFRIDGVLQTVARWPADLIPSMTSRIKIMSAMDIAERRKPQDGRYLFTKDQYAIDMRISCLPTLHGEKIVIRLLVKDMSLLNLDRLKMGPAVRETYEQVVATPMGMILVTGPTGSGKTTTLYATLMKLPRKIQNIVTLEEPVEYSLEGITQVQVNPATGLTFIAGLRSILRQDPDVILVGEIRDTETVQVACRAALTGHKVFSTLHTNDAPQAITRLLDMGVPPYLIAASVKGVLAQRLVRVVCTECREGYPMSDAERSLLGYPEQKEIFRGMGCSHCAGTGYMGRQACFEFLALDEKMQSMVVERSSAYAVRHAAQRQGMHTMVEESRRLVLEGTTTTAEFQRVIMADEGREQLCPHCSKLISIDFAVCPFCESVLKESCPKCGNPLDATWSACPNCGEEIEREWKQQTCSNCLATLESEWTHCPYCGQ